MQWKVIPIVTVLSLIVVAGVASTTRTVHADDRCIDVHGRIFTQETTENCASPLGLCTVGHVSGAGPLDGATTFLTLDAAPNAGMPGVEPATSLSYSGHFTLTTQDGSILESNDLGALDESALLFVEMYRPLSGTGQFANWSGHLFSTGVIVDNVTAFEGEIHGVICTPQ
ncbi:MAG TPA: hypothetical protein VEK07_18325 [Polyangiaceae bacterium]|nr:hypothetical protein [Polyangiaceae bacterium]